MSSDSTQDIASVIVSDCYILFFSILHSIDALCWNIYSRIVIYQHDRSASKCFPDLDRVNMAGYIDHSPTGNE